MSASPFRFRGAPGMGYDVDDRATGALLGDVREKVTRYNLRRVLVTRWWEARTPDREKIVDERGDPVHFATRGAAAAALLDAAHLPRPRGGAPSADRPEASREEEGPTP